MQLLNTLKRAKLSVSIRKRWVKLRHLIEKSKLATSKSKWKEKKEQGEANRKQMVLVVMILIQGATLVNWIPRKLGIPIPRNSWKLPIMQIALANWIPSFLGIPNYANKPWFKKLGITRNFLEIKGRLQFCEDLEFLGIPRNSQLYKLPII